MTDKEIIKLYWKRDEAALKVTDEKYGGYLFSIANNILGNSEDSRECVNDSYLRAWNSIPPEKPNVLSAYLGKIARNLAFDRYRKEHAEKRGNGEITEALDELSEIISDRESVEAKIERKEMLSAINDFLNHGPKLQSNIFVMRYWYVMSIRDIASKTGLTETNVATNLSRTRKALKEFLLQRGFEI